MKRYIVSTMVVAIMGASLSLHASCWDEISAIGTNLTSSDTSENANMIDIQLLVERAATLCRDGEDQEAQDLIAQARVLLEQGEQSQ